MKKYSYNKISSKLDKAGNSWVLANGRLGTQLQQIMWCFYECPKSMRMVEIQTNIMRPNICRYIKVLREKGLIQRVKYSRCTQTGRTVGFYTTNEQYFSDTPAQLDLFN